MDVEIWSDMSCVWCFITKRRFEAALRQFAHADEVSVVWRSFRLMKGGPAARPEPGDELAAERYGFSVERARALQDHITGVAAARDGLNLRFDLYVLSDMTDAHRLTHLSRAHGLQDEFEERMMQACLSDGETVSDHSTLTRLAGEVGIPEIEVAGVLTSDRYLDQVENDERLAEEIGVTAVPTFYINSNARYGPDHFKIVQGGEGPEVDVILEMLEHEWELASVGSRH